MYGRPEVKASWRCDETSSTSQPSKEFIPLTGTFGSNGSRFEDGLGTRLGVVLRFGGRHCKWSVIRDATRRK